MSTIDTSIIKSKTANTPVRFNDSGNVEVGTLCRAWVNFNGTGTVAINASFNVSSITDNGTGDYTINFTTAFVDTNYAVIAMSKGVDSTDFSGEDVIESYNTARTVSLVRICNGYGGTAYDTTRMNVAVFR